MSEEIRRLLDMWKARSAQHYTDARHTGAITGLAMSSEVQRCADELEALLAAPAVPAQEEARRVHIPTPQVMAYRPVATPVKAEPRPIRAAQEEDWHPIETAPLAQMVLLRGGGWRHPFVGQRNGDLGACYLDGFNNPEHGWQAYATHWMPLPHPPGAPAAPHDARGQE